MVCLLTARSKPITLDSHCASQLTLKHHCCWPCRAHASLPLGHVDLGNLRPRHHPILAHHASFEYER
jgi:hypothetical protein